MGETKAYTNNKEEYDTWSIEEKLEPGGAWRKEQLISAERTREGVMNSVSCGLNMEQGAGCQGNNFLVNETKRIK